MNRPGAETNPPAWEGYRLSRQQERLWQARHARTTSVAMAGASLHGPLDRTAFALAANALLERHEILRTSIRPVLGGTGPALMAVDAPRPAAIDHIDLRSLGSAEQDAQIATEAAARLVIH